MLGSLVLAGIGCALMSNPRRKRKTHRAAKRRNPNPRDLTEQSFTRGSATVEIATWRNANATAFIAVTARGPGGVKTWEAKSQGPSSGGFSKPDQAAERLVHKLTGKWPHEVTRETGSRLLAFIADAAAEKVGGTKGNPRRRGKRRNPGSIDHPAAHELELFIVNDGDLYRQNIQPVIKNLAKKMAKGIYDTDLAVKLWGYTADWGAQKYTKENGGSGNGSYGIFNKPTRMDVAKSLEEYYKDEVTEAANALGKKTNPRRRKSRRK